MTQVGSFFVSGAQIGDQAVSLKANDAFSLAGLEVRVRCAVVVEHGCWT
jgi:hypothetical protein